MAISVVGNLEQNEIPAVPALEEQEEFTPEKYDALRAKVQAAAYILCRTFPSIHEAAFAEVPDIENHIVVKLYNPQSRKVEFYINAEDHVKAKKHDDRSETEEIMYTAALRWLGVNNYDACPTTSVKEDDINGLKAVAEGFKQDGIPFFIVYKAGQKSFEFYVPRDKNCEIKSISKKTGAKINGTASREGTPIKLKLPSEICSQRDITEYRGAERQSITKASLPGMRRCCSFELTPADDRNKNSYSIEEHSIRKIGEVRSGRWNQKAMFIIKCHSQGNKTSYSLELWLPDLNFV